MTRSWLRGDELIADRWLRATPERVWTAFTTPAGIAAFWGGSHATVAPESVVVDARPGGEFAMDTGTTRLRFVYVSLDPPYRMVFDEPRTGLRTTVTIRADGGGSHLTVHQRRLPPRLRTRRAADGLASILDALSDHLEKENP